jgi:hypothetical protein
MNPSTQLSSGSASNESTTKTMTTVWTFLNHVIPNLPLCFSNYARSDTEYDAVPVNLIVQGR